MLGLRARFLRVLCSVNAQPGFEPGKSKTGGEEPRLHSHSFPPVGCIQNQLADYFLFGRCFTVTVLKCGHRAARLSPKSISFTACRKKLCRSRAIRHYAPSAVGYLSKHWPEIFLFNAGQIQGASYKAALPAKGSPTHAKPMTLKDFLPVSRVRVIHIWIRNWPHSNFLMALPLAVTQFRARPPQNTQNADLMTKPCI